MTHITAKSQVSHTVLSVADNEKLKGSEFKYCNFCKKATK